MHARLYCAATACALTLQACATTAGDAAEQGKTWVILPAHAPVVAVVGGTWKPSVEQVLAARDAAKRQIASDTHLRIPHTDRRWRLGLDYASDILREWNVYRMQAYGVTHSGRHMIHLCFLTPEHPDDGSWKHDLLMISDGGSAYWDAEYDPTSGKILWWQTHAVA